MHVSYLFFTWHGLGSGVPRCPVLGSMLFLMLIGDVPQVVKAPCLIYADDPKLWRTIREPDALDRWSHK